jgi:hypothetical protein
MEILTPPIGVGELLEVNESIPPVSFNMSVPGETIGAGRPSSGLTSRTKKYNLYGITISF